MRKERRHIGRRHAAVLLWGVLTLCRQALQGRRRPRRCRSTSSRSVDFSQMTAGTQERHPGRRTQSRLPRRSASASRPTIPTAKVVEQERDQGRDRCAAAAARAEAAGSRRRRRSRRAQARPDRRGDQEGRGQEARHRSRPTPRPRCRRRSQPQQPCPKFDPQAGRWRCSTSARRSARRRPARRSTTPPALGAPSGHGRATVAKRARRAARAAQRIAGIRRPARQSRGAVGRRSACSFKPDGTRRRAARWC